MDSDWAQLISYFNIIANINELLYGLKNDIL